MTDEEVEEKIRQEFKMKGLILADVNIIKKKQMLKNGNIKSESLKRFFEKMKNIIKHFYTKIILT